MAYVIGRKTVKDTSEFSSDAYGIDLDFKSKEALMTLVASVIWFNLSFTLSVTRRQSCTSLIWPFDIIFFAPNCFNLLESCVISCSPVASEILAFNEIHYW